MGNKHPTEYNGATCYKCSRSLPPMRSFDNMQNTTIDGRPVYIFNNGQYYRWHGGGHQCPDCFFRPKREREEQERREETRREEERKQEEIRRQAEKREASVQQANKNASNLEQESNEWHNKNEAKAIHNEMQNTVTSKWVPVSFDIPDENLFSYAFEEFYNLFEEIYGYELDYVGLKELTSEAVTDLIEPMKKWIETEWIAKTPPDGYMILSVQLFAVQIFIAQLKLPKAKEVAIENEVNLIIQKISQSAESDIEMLHFTINLLSAAKGRNQSLIIDETPISRFCLTIEDLNKELLTDENISETDTFSVDFLETLLLNSIRTLSETKAISVTQKISSILIARSLAIFNFDDCSLIDSFSELSLSWDSKSVWIALRTILQQCTSIQHEIKNYCEAFQNIITFRIAPKQIINGQDTVLDIVTKSKSQEFAKEVRGYVNRVRKQIKGLDELLEEINESKLVETKTLESIRIILINTKRRLETFGYPSKVNTEMLEQLSSARMLQEWKEKIVTMKDNPLPRKLDILEESLTLLSCVINKLNGWWPRDTQLISCAILMLSDNSGQLIEMNTGEGKSCVVSMFAAMLACQGNYVDIITSSPILAVRDAKEWNEFYATFGLTVSNNINKKDDKSRYQCYLSSIVYGTVTNFASDILRQEFHMKNIRPNRTIDSVIVDEVDSMLLDQGIQFTHLSHQTPGLHHLNPVLAMVWCSVSQFTPLQYDSDVMWCAPPQPFFRTMYDAIDPEECGVTEPLQLLKMGESSGVLFEGFTERYEKATDESTKENEEMETKQDLLRHVSIENIFNFFILAEDYLPCSFIFYILVENNSIARYERPQIEQKEAGRVDVPILVVAPGVCCLLSDSIKDISEPIEERIRDLVLRAKDNTDKAGLDIPKYLHPFFEKRVSVWIENAFFALKMQNGREYVLKREEIIPIDYSSTGVVELNKRWSNGLQQFLQMKHKQQLTPLTLVTNFLSNTAFFKRYSDSLFGMTGTLGNANDHKFLLDTYRVKLCKIPTFCTNKLFEFDGKLCPNRSSWVDCIVEILKDKLAPKSWGGKGRAALIICEDINSANALRDIVFERVNENVKLYIRSDTDQLNIVHNKLEPQEIIVATNLAGRGTNIKVTDEVDESGGLLVLLSFLPPNARVERQAFGRTARKGAPGSVQMVVNWESLPGYLTKAVSIANATYLRDESVKKNAPQNDIEEVQIKERLFAEYCTLLQPIHQLSIGYEEKKVIVSVLNEYWGLWLLVNSDNFEQIPEAQLMTSLKEQVLFAKSQALAKRSPTNNFYHLIKFGNEILLYDLNYDKSFQLFSQAITANSEWTVIAYYNRAYCRIQIAGDNYKDLAKEDLNAALESLKMYKEQEVITMQLNENARSRINDKSDDEGGEDNETYLSKQIASKFQVYNFFEKNIKEALDKLEELKDDDVETVEATIFSLVSDPDALVHVEMFSLWQHGLINVYSIKKKPRFCWEGLVVFLIGALQVVAGIILTVFSAGTLSNIGIGLIVEGVSDIMDGVIAMVTGDFSWEEWAISKAISIATSLIGFGVGKLLSKGVKGFKLAAKAFSQELKALPKLAKSQIKGGLTQVMKENLKNAGKYAGKELVEEGVLRTLQFAQDKILQEFMELVKEGVKEMIQSSVHESIFKGGLGATMDEIVLQQISGINNSFVLSAQDGPSGKLEKTIVNFASKVLDLNMKDLGWQQQLSSALQGTMYKIQGRLAKEGKLNKYKAIFEIADSIHMGALLIDATSSIQALLNEFNLEYNQSLEDFMEESELTKYDLSNPIKGNNDFIPLKTNIANSLTKLLVDAIVTIVEQKFSSHLVTKGQKKMNGTIIKFVGDKLLKGNMIEERLRAGETALMISTMSTQSDMSIDMISHKYAHQINDMRTPGSILDLRILSEKIGVKVSILEPLENNQYRKMLNIHPDIAKENTEAIQLLYRAASTEYPDGHYDVLRNGKILEVDSLYKNCAYHALSKALYPNNSEAENRKQANYFRQLEAEELVANSHKWDYFVMRKEQVETFSRAIWYLGVGGGKRKIIDEEDSTPEQKNEVSKIMKKFPEIVYTKLCKGYKGEAIDRWDTIVDHKANATNWIDVENKGSGINN